ncbi:MAG: calcineurin-like phosphoesterase C-terminal domain-containing protein [Bacteroidales bacterium]|nr:calcineurin-like phosphoesterase C-terminal domain-containing protein [Bacteroidales bacterium]
MSFENINVIDKSILALTPAGISTISRIGGSHWTLSDCTWLAEYTHGFENARSDNKVLINVFNWNVKYNIKVTEVQTGKVLPVTRVDNYDPLHIVHFNMQRVNNNQRDFSFETGKTGHFFECTCSNASNSVKIEVTDENGTTYTETMARPRKLSTMKNETKW